jgi:phosphopantothenoylcysteine decarboxylase/phosphopantothenate--cysteine ligase
MSVEKKKCVVLGVTGSIAAYKGAELCGKLAAAGFEVVVSMTASAKELVGEQTFLTLSRNPVICDLWTTPTWRPEHVALAERAELLVVAPCTANFIGKYANGIADDALTTIAMTHERKVLLAPAMNPRMWRSPAVQENVERLKRRGVEFIGPASGRLACGPDGEGRMAEVQEILDAVKTLL